MTQIAKPNYVLRQLIDGKFVVVFTDSQVINMRDVMQAKNTYCEIWARSVVRESYNLIASSAPQ